MKSKRDIYLENRPLEESIRLWREELARDGAERLTPVECVNVDDAQGRVTAEAVRAARSWPFYNASAMDGIAVRYLDTAGASEARPLRLRRPAGFAHVNTGHALPDGFDAVVMIEEVHETGPGEVELIAAATPWQHVRTVGEDIVQGELIVPQGHRIRPVDIGAMLATGVSKVRVRRVPRVLVIPTGSEVVQPGEALRPGNIIEFNGRILAGMLREWGAEADRHPVVRDDPQALRAALEEGARNYDLIVLNAGASAGTEDYTASIIEALGRVVVHGVDIKPGKPVILGRLGDRPVVGLPGYPVSAVITLRLFVRDLLAAMVGARPASARMVDAVIARPVASRMGVNEFLRMKLGRVGDRLIATPTGRGAGAVMSLVEADGIAMIPAGSEGAGAGETISVELLRESDEIDRTLVFIGSHDNTLDILADLLAGHRPWIGMSSAHVGSMGGIMALRRGEAHVAGVHLLDENTGQYNVPFIQRLLPDLPLDLINLTHRQQGLLLPRGNPKGIRGFQDLARGDVRFINRQRGAGTRLLADRQLREIGLSPDRVTGYGHEEYTHMGVAAAVSGGTADTGLGILAAAVAMDLDFLPVARERYDLIVPRTYREDPRVLALLELIRTSEAFRREVEALGGYDLSDCGRVLFSRPSADESAG